MGTNRDASRCGSGRRRCHRRSPRVSPTAVANAKVKRQTRERAEALAALDRAKTLFLSDVSHEFRTPLTLLLSPLDQVAYASITHQQRAGPADDSATCCDATAEAGAVDARLLARRSRTHAGSFRSIGSRATDTADLVSLFRSTFERARCDSPSTARHSQSRSVSIATCGEKIVLNLVSNAFKFTLDRRGERDAEVQMQSGRHFKCATPAAGSRRRICLARSRDFIAARRLKLVRLRVLALACR